MTTSLPIRSRLGGRNNLGERVYTFEAERTLAFSRPLTRDEQQAIGSLLNGVVELWSEAMVALIRKQKEIVSVNDVICVMRTIALARAFAEEEK